MAYSVMVWMVDPGRQSHEEQDLQRSVEQRDKEPGAAGGVNVAPPFTRMVYGVYDSEPEARATLDRISESLSQNRPLRLNMHGDRTFLIPAQRVHYVVCDEVERPKDR